MEPLTTSGFSRVIERVQAQAGQSENVCDLASPIPAALAANATTATYAIVSRR